MRSTYSKFTQDMLVTQLNASPLPSRFTVIRALIGLGLDVNAFDAAHARAQAYSLAAVNAWIAAVSQ